MANRNTMPNQTVNPGWMSTGNEAWWATASEHQSEMLDFMSHRLFKGSQAARELGQCRSWEEAMGIQSNWLHGTFTDYSAEATKVMAINVKHGADVAQRRKPRH